MAKIIKRKAETTVEFESKIPKNLIEGLNQSFSNVEVIESIENGNKMMFKFTHDVEIDIAKY